MTAALEGIRTYLDNKRGGGLSQNITISPGNTSDAIEYKTRRKIYQCTYDGDISVKSYTFKGQRSKPKG